jgi:acyl-CoA thioesterase
MSILHLSKGVFLGPTSLDRQVHYRVTKLRDTRAFSTRFLVASQIFDEKMRDCCAITIDFTVAAGQPLSLQSGKLPLVYSQKASRMYPSPEDLQKLTIYAQDKQKAGTISSDTLREFQDSFGLSERVTDTRIVPGGIFAETLYGIDPRVDTKEQLEQPDVTKRRPADYFRSLYKLEGSTGAAQGDEAIPLRRYALQASYLCFTMDGALAFMPLSQHGLRLQDASACSTVDFAMRFHQEDLPVDAEYHLREMRTYSSAHERTFNEALVFDQSGTKLVASSTQTCILRALRPSRI